MLETCNVLVKFHSFIIPRCIQETVSKKLKLLNYPLLRSCYLYRHATLGRSVAWRHITAAKESTYPYWLRYIAINDRFMNIMGHQRLPQLMFSVFSSLVCLTVYWLLKWESRGWSLLWHHALSALPFRRILRFSLCQHVPLAFFNVLIVSVNLFHPNSFPGPF